MAEDAHNSARIATAGDILDAIAADRAVLRGPQATRGAGK